MQAGSSYPDHGQSHSPYPDQYSQQPSQQQHQQPPQKKGLGGLLDKVKSAAQQKMNAGGGGYGQQGHGQHGMMGGGGYGQQQGMMGGGGYGQQQGMMGGGGYGQQGMMGGGYGQQPMMGGMGGMGGYGRQGMMQPQRRQGMGAGGAVRRTFCNTCIRRTLTLSGRNGSWRWCKFQNSFFWLLHG